MFERELDYFNSFLMCVNQKMTQKMDECGNLKMMVLIQ